MSNASRCWVLFRVFLAVILLTAAGLKAYQLATTPLGYDVKVDEAQSHGKTIFEYAPRSRGAQMLAAIASEIHGGPAPRKRKRAAPRA